MENYTRKFAEPLLEGVDCDCESCEDKYKCADSNLAESCKKMKEAIKKFLETCPEGSKPRSGGCAAADGNSYLKGKCDVGWAWDPTAGSTGKCIKHTDK
jgi:hypothetical protein